LHSKMAVLSLMVALAFLLAPLPCPGEERASPGAPGQDGAAVTQGKPGLSAAGLLGLLRRENLPYGVRIVLIFTALSLAPAILVMVTSFTRIIIVLHFIRRGLGLQEVPPTSVLMGLALFLTLFTMRGVITDIHRDAVGPVTEGKITIEEGLARGAQPLHRFMLAQTRQKDLKLFARFARASRIRSASQVPLSLLIPAFVLSELKTAFQIGIVIFIPFLLVDLVVASTLLSMGLSGLSPHGVSLPFKLLLFVLVDGWGLIISSLLRSFR